MRWFLAFCLAAVPAFADEIDLELVLLADASRSIDQQELIFQRQGYATAITDPTVLNAIASTLTGSIAVTYVEWATNQATVVDWTIIDGPDSAQAFAEALMIPPRQAFGRNAIGSALLEGKRLIETNGIDGLRAVIDFSGDSANSFTGPTIAEARAEVLAAGITINGLPILCPACGGWAHRDLETAYRDQIIGGPGAFVVAAEGWEGFIEAVRRKLVLEISGLTPETDHAAARP